MTDKDRALDIQIRLPDDKKYIKTKLKRIAKKNRLSMTQLVTLIFEWWLDARESGTKFNIPIE